MTLQEFCSVFETCTKITIWHEQDEMDAIFEGSIFDVPFGWLKCEIVKPNDDFDGGYISKDAGLVIMIKGQREPAFKSANSSAGQSNDLLSHGSGVRIPLGTFTIK